MDSTVLNLSGKVSNFGAEAALIELVGESCELLAEVECNDGCDWLL
jgi:hypothetical protein